MLTSVFNSAPLSLGSTASCQTQNVMTISNPTTDMLLSALRDQMDAGVDFAILDTPAGPEDELTVSQIMAFRKGSETQPNPSVAANAAMTEEKEAPNRQSPALDSTAKQSSGLNQVSTLQLTELSDLPALKTAMSQFDGCALKQTASSLVFADGNPDADIMIIGEAPGRDEDKMGIPFVGAAGQLLDKMLSSVGLDRTQVYITNILPWRPPGNRTPSPEETQMMTPFLRRHIELVSPRLILALGGSSAKLLLNSTQGILKLRGKPSEVEISNSARIPVLPSLHPAYLLRAPAMKKLAYSDLLLLKQMAGNTDTAST